MKVLNIIFLLLFVFSSQLYSQTDKRISNYWNAQIIQTLLKHDIPELSCDSAKLRLSDYIILDTREEKEFKVSHLKGAKWVGYESFSVNNVQEFSKEKKILCYCSIGYRSEDICRRLKNNGFANVYNLYGGIFEWVNRGYPIVNLQNATTMDIHGFDFVWGKMLKKGNIVY